MDDKAGMLLDISEDGLKVALSSLPSHRQIMVKLTLDDQDFLLAGTIRWIRKPFPPKAPTNWASASKTLPRRT